MLIGIRPFFWCLHDLSKSSRRFIHSMHSILLITAISRMLLYIQKRLLRFLSNYLVLRFRKFIFLSLCIRVYCSLFQALIIANFLVIIAIQSVLALTFISLILSLINWELNFLNVFLFFFVKLIFFSCITDVFSFIHCWNCIFYFSSLARTISTVNTFSSIGFNRSVWFSTRMCLGWAHHCPTWFSLFVISILSYQFGWFLIFAFGQSIYILLSFQKRFFILILL